MKEFAFGAQRLCQARLCRRVKAELHSRQGQSYGRLGLWDIDGGVNGLLIIVVVMSEI